MKVPLLVLLGAPAMAALAACETEVRSSDAPADAGQLAVSKLPQSSNAYTLFETLQVRPLALSPSGNWLFAANTPDNRLEVFQVGPHGLVHRGAVPVGLEPVAVAAASDDEVWVVNQLSDSVSVVKLAHDGRSGAV